MALKFIVDSLEGMDEATQKLYKKNEESGKFELQIDGLPKPKEEDADLAGLKKKVHELLDEKKKEQEKRKKAEEDAAEAAREAAKKKGDTDALERSWQEKFDKAKIDSETTISSLKTEIHRLTVSADAGKLAAELAADPAFIPGLVPFIESRLKVDNVDGKFVTKVIDDAGQASAMTMAELKDHLKTLKHLQPLIAGTRASGGGAVGGGGGGGFDNLFRDKMSPVQIREFIQKYDAEHGTGTGQTAYLKLPRSTDKKQ